MFGQPLEDIKLDISKEVKAVVEEYYTKKQLNLTETQLEMRYDAMRSLVLKGYPLLFAIDQISLKENWYSLGRKEERSLKNKVRSQLIQMLGMLGLRATRTEILPI